MQVFVIYATSNDAHHSAFLTFLDSSLLLGIISLTEVIIGFPIHFLNFITSNQHTAELCAITTVRRNKGNIEVSATLITEFNGFFIAEHIKTGISQTAISTPRQSRSPREPSRRARPSHRAGSGRA